MGYEVDKVKSIRIVNRETGEEIYSKELGDWDVSMPYTVEEPTVSAEEKNARLTIPKETAQLTVTSIMTPPRPNIKMIISPGDHSGNSQTVICFYRPKYYNWFQRFMYKICFGIIIKQGDEVKREFI
jgi:hypothetical protein